MLEIDRHKRFLIVGAGTTGRSVARYLKRHDVSFSIVDSRESVEGLDLSEWDGVEIVLGGFEKIEFSRFDAVVVSPGISLKTDGVAHAISKGIEVIGDVELFARDVSARSPSPEVVAVTGSNGKSTVVSMVAAMLLAGGIKTAVGGNLGTPSLDLLNQHEQPQVYVLELSSFQLETTHSLHASVAIVLNVSEDHMDRYDSFDDYAATKRTIFENANACIVNASDPRTFVQGALANFSVTDSGADYTLKDNELLRFGERILPASSLKVEGSHNIENALAAIALVDALGLKALDNTAALHGLSAFSGLPHRSQWIARADDVDWYNDSKGTNVGATVAAINGFSRPLVLIAGGEGKGADFTELRRPVSNTARAVVLIGRDASLIEDVLHGDVDIYHAVTMRDAVVKARALARPGDAVLLSPACASFDMYESYMARGDDFIHKVHEVLS
ncbi:MAG: UDP-N-acetylmuramoyl-L-alanine--D-glutamate ligase [Pseudomonadota bacterium]